LENRRAVPPLTGLLWELSLRIVAPFICLVMRDCCYWQQKLPVQIEPFATQRQATSIIKTDDLFGGNAELAACISG